MSKRWTFEDDLHVVRFAAVAGVKNVANDLGRTEQSVKARIARLDGRAAKALKSLDQADYKFRRIYHDAIGDRVGVELLDEFHAGGPA